MAFDERGRLLALFGAMLFLSVILFILSPYADTVRIPTFDRPIGIVNEEFWANAILVSAVILDIAVIISLAATENIRTTILVEFLAGVLLVIGLPVIGLVQTLIPQMTQNYIPAIWGGCIILGALVIRDAYRRHKAINASMEN